MPRLHAPRSGIVASALALAAVIGATVPADAQRSRSIYDSRYDAPRSDQARSEQGWRNERGARFESNGRSTSAPVTSSADGPSRARSVKVPAVYAPGSIVVVNNERKLYYITGRGTARQYGVAVGKNAELWMGRTFIADKKVDPRWIPVNGDEPVEGGDPANPLGKRALYLDWSLLRIHGTPSRGSIGSATSNGCVRMLNEDVVDLFERVHIGAPVYAIKSWPEATRYETQKVAEKIYVDPEAHRQAQEELQQQLAELAQSRADEARAQRGLPPSRMSPAPTYQATAAPTAGSRQSRPQTWGNPSALGR